MLKFKNLCVSFLVLTHGACKIKQEIPANGQLQNIPDRFTINADTLETDLPNYRSFFHDANLIALIDTALKNNFDLKMTLQKIEIAKAGVRFTQGLGKPDLAGSFNIGQRKFGRYTIDGVGNFDTQFSSNLNDRQQIPDPVVPDFSLGVQSSWEIDLWGMLKSQKASAASRFLASEAGKNLLVSEIVALILEAYYDLLILDNELLFLEENITLQ